MDLKIIYSKICLKMRYSDIWKRSKIETMESKLFTLFLIKNEKKVAIIAGKNVTDCPVRFSTMKSD